MGKNIVSELFAHSSVTSRFNWDALDLPTAGLSMRDAPFTMDEIKKAIDDMPVDKAPGPDSFSGTILGCAGIRSSMICTLRFGSSSTWIGVA